MARIVIPAIMTFWFLRKMEKGLAMECIPSREAARTCEKRGQAPRGNSNHFKNRNVARSQSPFSADRPRGQVALTMRACEDYPKYSYAGWRNIAEMGQPRRGNSRRKSLARQNLHEPGYGDSTDRARQCKPNRSAHCERGPHLP